MAIPWVAHLALTPTDRPLPGICPTVAASAQKTGVRVSTPQVTRSEGTAGSGRLWVLALTSFLGLGESP